MGSAGGHQTVRSSGVGARAMIRFVCMSVGNLGDRPSSVHF